MGRIVITWELGGGFGHLGVLHPIADHLQLAGHEITLITRNLPATFQVFGNDVPMVLQAPIKTRPPARRTLNPLTYAEMLLNLGYESAEELRSLVQGWRNQFRQLRPDCILLDHSPTAALAAHSMNIPCATIGTGFCQPPHGFPLPPMASWRSEAEEILAESESKILGTIHEAVPELKHRISGIGSIFQECTSNFLTTFRELDHYQSRGIECYWGSWTGFRNTQVEDITWPKSPGKRVFAYLKPMQCVGELLEWLSDSEHSTIVVSEGIDFSPVRNMASPRIRLLNRPVNLNAIKQDCDLAIINGGHGATCEFLLAGVPLFQIPLLQEQSILARNTVKRGYARMASPDSPEPVIRELEIALSDESLKDSARNFSASYGDYSALASQEAIGQHLCDLCE